MSSRMEGAPEAVEATVRRAEVRPRSQGWDAIDPTVVDWATMDLPPAWPDSTRPRETALLLSGFFRRRRRVRLPPGLPGAAWLPRYLLREFHHLPNGYYSQHLSRGYTRAFELVMLGRLDRARRWIADRLGSCRAVLDVGCGAGRLAAALTRAGVPEVWGLDPCPYLLRQAAIETHDVRFVQGVAEHTPFADERFDGIGACFVLHELPSRIADGVFAEMRRLLAPGGLLAVVEPAPDHFYTTGWRRRGGLPEIYFSLLARRMYEPYVRGWHRRDVGASLERSGFTPIEMTTALPFRQVLARLG
jgi:ubiquinone/menaquinone biosynthesis C-methylase UbiE